MYNICCWAGKRWTSVSSSKARCSSLTGPLTSTPAASQKTINHERSRVSKGAYAGVFSPHVWRDVISVRQILVISAFFESALRWIFSRLPWPSLLGFFWMKCFFGRNADPYTSEVQIVGKCWRNVCDITQSVKSQGVAHVLDILCAFFIFAFIGQS